MANSSMNVASNRYSTGLVSHGYISSSFSSVSGHVSMNWIVDSGASDHMCYDFNCFSDIKVLDKPFAVRLPTGDSVFVSQYGNVGMTSDLVFEWSVVWSSF